MEMNVKEGLARRCGLDVPGSDLRSVLDFDEDGRRSSEGIQVGELLEWLRQNQISKEESGRHYEVAKFDSWSPIHSEYSKEFVFVLLSFSRLFHGYQIKVEKRTALFWDITQRVVVIS
jgi:hypothetical protein